MLISKNNDAHVLGFTALHIAVQENDTAAVQLLLESHADTNIQNKYGITFWISSIEINSSNGTITTLDRPTNPGYYKH